MNPETLEARLSSSLITIEDAEPVFVVGSVRSGTSIVMEALRSGGELRGFNEGNVASMVQRMWDVLDHHEDDAGPLRELRARAPSKVDTEGLKIYTANTIAALYAKQMGSGPWMDKSPESYLGAPMIRFCPTLGKIYPKARFLMCLRRGIENVMSRQRKFPDVPFRSLCRSWADAAAAWWEIREELGERGLIVRQDEIALHPERVAKEMSDFLGMGKRRRQAIEDVFTYRRPEQSQFAQDHRFIGLDETPWDQEQKETFAEVCTEIMETVGFPMEGKELVSAAPIRLFFPIAEESVEKCHLSSAEAFRRGEGGAIILDANPASQPPAEVRYLEVPLRGQKSFSARVGVAGSGSGPVVCALRIVSAAGEEGALLKRSVSPGQSVEWSEEFPALDGVFSVEISARRDGDGAEVVATTWVNARLEA